MALYENLPVYKVAYDLLLQVYRLCTNMERSYRYSLGERIQKEMTELILNIYRANSSREKKTYIQAAKENITVVRLLFRVAHDSKQLQVKHFVSVNEQIESISKQLTAWGKSAI
ncbi:four helix bundle protein [Dysgonomonas sp. 216]|uniref:four helix bundle protein n=1 Tax=Dysgonomonas sp. 216 TaxID=2302934 RepID=UPI0013D875AC|nr:four helix bundle protein [Dysgonomonas sp. 216]NDW18742.1 four helix bundle protein [Dysgonomonas sp. 216]